MCAKWLLCHFLPYSSRPLLKPWTSHQQLKSFSYSFHWDTGFLMGACQKLSLVALSYRDIFFFLMYQGYLGVTRFFSVSCSKNNSSLAVATLKRTKDYHLLVCLLTFRILDLVFRFQLGQAGTQLLNILRQALQTWQLSVLFPAFSTWERLFLDYNPVLISLKESTMSK